MSKRAIYIAVDETGYLGYGESESEARHDLAPCEDDASHVLRFDLEIPLPPPNPENPEGRER